MYSSSTFPHWEQQWQEVTLPPKSVVLHSPESLSLTGCLHSKYKRQY